MTATESVHGVTTEYGHRERIEHTFTTGLLAGLTLRRGWLTDHPTEGVGITFDAIANPGLAALLKRQKSKAKSVFVRLSSNPEIGPAVAEVQRRQREREVTAAATLEAQRQQDAALIAQVEREEATLVALIPADHVRVEVVQTGDLDGYGVYRYTADGVVIPWDTPGLVDHGTASAIRPGALAPFEVRRVVSISRADLDAHLAREQAKADEKAEQKRQRLKAKEQKEKDALAEAARTGKPVLIESSGYADDSGRYVENSYTVVSRWAQPDGSTTTTEAPTH